MALHTVARRDNISQCWIAPYIIGDWSQHFIHILGFVSILNFEFLFLPYRVSVIECLVYGTA